VLVVAATERELAHVRRFRTHVCGIGPVEAAISVTRALLAQRPEAVLHVGIAGARGIEPLSVVLGSESIYCDVAAAVPVIDRVAPAAALFERVHAALPDAVVAPIGTSAAIGGSNGCDVEAMEGFGVLRACEDLGVPAVELRVVSNAIGEADRTRWRVDEAFAVLGAVLDRLDVV
jgi:futalosine hydrolase